MVSELQPTGLLVPIECAAQPFFQVGGRTKTDLAAGPSGIAHPARAAGFGYFVTGQDTWRTAQAAPPFGAGSQDVGGTLRYGERAEAAAHQARRRAGELIPGGCSGVSHIKDTASRVFQFRRRDETIDQVCHVNQAKVAP